MSTGWLAQSSTTSSARWITYAVAGGTESTVEAARTASVCLETSRASHLLWHLVQVLVPYSKGLCLQRDVRAHKGEEAWRGKGSYGGRYSGCPSSRTGGARCPPPRGSGGASLGTPPGTGTPPASSGANEVAGAEWVEAEAEAVWAGEAVWAEAMDRGGSGTAAPSGGRAASGSQSSSGLGRRSGRHQTRPRRSWAAAAALQPCKPVRWVSQGVPGGRRSLCLSLGPSGKRGGLVSPMWDQCGVAPSTALNCASPLTGKAAKWASTGRTLWQQSAVHV